MRASAVDAALVVVAGLGTALGLTLMKGGTPAWDGLAWVPMARFAGGFALYIAAFAASLALFARRAIAVAQPLLTGATLVAAFGLDSVVDPASVGLLSALGAGLVLGGIALLAGEP